MLVHSDKQYRERVEFVAFAPTGDLYSSSYDGLFHWPDPTAQARVRVCDAHHVARPRFSPCGRYVATSDYGLTVYDLRENTHTEVRVWEPNWRTAFAFAPNGDLIVCQTHANTPGGYAGRRAFGNWDEARWDRQLPEVGLGAPVMLGADRFAFAWYTWATENYSRFLTCSAETGAELSLVKGLGVLASPLAHSAQHRLLAGLLRDQLVILRDDDCSAALATVKNDSRKHFTDLAFHPSGKYLAAINGENVKLYDPATWALAHTFAWKVGKLKRVAFSSDGALAAAGSDKGQVVVWDVDL